MENSWTKRFLLFLILLLVGLGAYGIKALTQPSATPLQALSSLDSRYLTEADLLEKAPLTVMAQVNSLDEPFRYGGVDFQRVNLTLSEQLHGPSLPKEISVLQTLVPNSGVFLPLEKDASYVLFLEPYTGPVTSKEAYVICGVSFGLVPFSSPEVSTSTERNEQQSRAGALNRGGIIFSVPQLKAYYSTKN